MNIRELVKQCHCKYANWAREQPESATMWLVCSLKGIATDIINCKKCKERISTESESEK